MRMNKIIAKPLIIQFTSPETNPIPKRSSKSVFLPANTPWDAFRTAILPMVGDSAYDSVLVHVKDDVDRDMAGVVGSMSVKLNALAGAGTRVGKPVLSYEAPDKPFYLANPTKSDMQAAGLYAPSDETVMNRYNSFESDDAWQEHQSKIWARMKDMMPLSKKADDFNRNHAAQLKDPKRGLEDKDLKKFWSFKPRQGLSPTLMGDDMVGMPSVEGREYEGFIMANKRPDGSVVNRPLKVRSLMTVGAAGIAIPMANANGHVSKHQIASDLTAYSTALHFRAPDGKTVAKGEIFNKKTREYAFNFADGTPTHLKVTDVSRDEVITMKDAHGIFNVKPKKEIIDILKDRGYVVPDIIASVKPEQNGKYMWQSPGTMTGSEEILKTVSPSKPGFIKAREPKNGSNEYVVLVAEGALKGHIVAKYADVKDSKGVCFGDTIAGDKGIIVTQVPGVSEAYIKNALTIYDKYKIAGTYIAMDADGRENLNVARGIHSAYNYVSKIGPVSVLSWDPAQKGMDDALLAVAQGKITIKDMDIACGTPEKLFPLDKAHQMTPYTLSGVQKDIPSWLIEYREDQKAREEKIASIQAATAAREQASEVSDEKPQWVETPADISNIQSATITKSAEMKDAVNGKLPPARPDAKITSTPDVDEAVAEKDEKEEAKEASTMESVDEAILQEAKKWDARNPAMQPIPVPEGYKAFYRYKQPVVDTGTSVPEPFRADTDYHAEDKWGIVTVTTDKEIMPQEKGERRDELQKNGFSCIGNMRLVEQTFTLDDTTAKMKDLGDQLKL